MKHAIFISCLKSELIKAITDSLFKSISYCAITIKMVLFSMNVGLLILHNEFRCVFSNHTAVNGESID